MNKAILVIDMPEYCDECIMCVENCFHHEMCIAASERILTSGKPDWCPLKPAPYRKDVDWLADNAGWSCGWNDCLKEIVCK